MSVYRSHLQTCAGLQEAPQRRAMQASIRNLRLAYVALVLVLSAGVYFRVAQPEKKLVWHDEIYTQLFAAGHGSSDWRAPLQKGERVPVATLQAFLRADPHRSVTDTIQSLAHDEPQHPPVYYVLARLWGRWFGEGISALRWLSIVASLLAFPAFAWVLVELKASRAVLGFGLALFAWSPLLVLYAQEAREYALWTLEILLMTAALLRALRLSALTSTGRATRVGGWGLYAFFTALSLYTSFSTVAVIGAHLLFLLVCERGQVRRPLREAGLALAVSGLVFLPWALLLWRHFDNFKVSMAWSSDIVIPRLELVNLVALNLSRNFIDLGAELAGPRSYLVVWLVVVLVGLAFWSLRAVMRQSQLLLLLFAVPMGMLLGPDLLVGGIRSLSARYLMPAWLGALLAVAFWIGAQVARRRTGWLAAGCLLAVAGFSCWQNAGRVSVWTKGVSRALPEVAQALNQASAPLIVANWEHHNPGNLLALSNMLQVPAEVQLTYSEVGYALPRPLPELYLFSPTAQFREVLALREQVRLQPVVQDAYVELWRVVPLASP